MKQKDIAVIIMVGFFAAIVSFFVASAVFKPAAGSTEVPEVSAIDPTFPDVQADPAYKAFFNKNALDPTQPVQIGKDKQSDPFR